MTLQIIFCQHIAISVFNLLLSIFLFSRFLIHNNSIQFNSIQFNSIQFNSIYKINFHLMRFPIILFQVFKSDLSVKEMRRSPFMLNLKGDQNKYEESSFEFLIIFLIINFYHSIIFSSPHSFYPISITCVLQ